MVHAAMASVSRWLVQQPMHILLVAMCIAALFAALQATRLSEMPRSNVFWIPALAWAAYAGWEWLVMWRSPEADLRVDLLLIWPVLCLLMLWSVVRAARGAWLSSRAAKRA